MSNVPATPWLAGFQLIGDECISSPNRCYFIGFNNTNAFGIYQGTIQAPGPIKTLIASDCDNAALSSSGLTVTDNSVFGVSRVAFQSPQPNPAQSCFGELGDDGVFSIYTGTDPTTQGVLVWSVGDPEVPQASSDVTVYNDTNGQFSFTVMWDGGPSPSVHVDGNMGGSPPSGSITVSGPVGTSCYLQWWSPLGGSPHSSGDNFNMGDQGVCYNLDLSINPFDPPSWQRTH